MADRQTRSVTLEAQDALLDGAMLSRSAVMTKSDGGLSLSGLRQPRTGAGAANKITGRRRCTPRKFVVTDLPDHEEMFATPTASPSKLLASSPARSDDGAKAGSRRYATLRFPFLSFFLSWRFRG